MKNDISQFMSGRCTVGSSLKDKPLLVSFDLSSSQKVHCTQYSRTENLNYESCIACSPEVRSSVMSVGPVHVAHRSVASVAIKPRMGGCVRQVWESQDDGRQPYDTYYNQYSDRSYARLQRMNNGHVSAIQS